MATVRKVANPLLSLFDDSAHVEARHGVNGTRLYDVAIDFGAPDKETHALGHGAALVDLTNRGLLVITGADRAPWLHGLCTQDIKGLEHSHGAYACHVDIKGRIMADMRVGVWQEMILMDLEPGLAPGLRRALKRFVVMEDVKVVDRTNVTGTIGLIGPQAAAVLQDLCGLSFDQLPTHHLQAAQIANLEVLVAATDQFGVPGFRISVARQDTAELWQHLLQAAPQLQPCGLGALEHAQLKAGIPRFGVELSPKVLFNEAELTTAVSFTKGCYLGQEVVERVDARGRVGRRLLGLVLQNATAQNLPPNGSAISNDQRKLGHLTSVAWDEELNAAIALGFIHRADNEPGARLKVDSDWEAIVVERGHWGVEGLGEVVGRS